MTEPDAASPVRLVRTPRFADERGWFAEVYSERRFRALGIACGFVQDNHSLSRRIGTVRGLHFQRPPHAQAKLVRCVRGRIFDVVVDIRRGSPTYGRFVTAELSHDNGDQIFVPVGFAHGFCALAPDTEVVYKVSDFYAPDCDTGILWNDPDLGIPWPVRPEDAVLSRKDTELPRLRDIASPFEFEGGPLRPLD